MKIKGSHQSFKSGCAVSSVVEHFLDTEGVTGSNPVSRTIFNWPLLQPAIAALHGKIPLSSSANWCR
jgi:hypothetical protein